MATRAESRTQIDYTCGGCGAQAVSVAPPGRRGNGATQVVVPHGPGCPVAAHVAAARTRALAGRR